MKEFDGKAADFDVSAADGVKVLLEVRRGAESTRDVGSEGSVFEVSGGAVGLMEKAVIGGGRVGRICEVSGGRWGGGGGMWSRHKFSLTRLEPTRTGVGSPGTKMDSVVGVRRQEPEV